MLQLLRRAPATALLLGFMVLAFLLETMASGSLFATDDGVLRRLGANEPALFWAGQYWRLLASMFLHIGLIHLLFNGWALLQIGALFELALGTLQMLLTFFVSGLAASFASVLWMGRSGEPQGLSAGASGAIFGLMGGLIAFLFRHRERLRPAAKGLLSQLLFWAVINIALGFTLAGIDNAAHLGGLAVGLLIGFLLPEPPHPIAAVSG